jgi:AcrR family transcriptional regulator
MEKQVSIEKIRPKRDKERKMTQNTGNLRVRRTQKLLREALIALVEERGFDALTVGEITQRAMVSRAAFYRNYQDKYDLVERIFEEAMQPLMDAIGHFGPERPPEQWVQLFEHVAENERLYRALLGGKGSFWFTQKMRASLAEMTRGHTRPTANRPSLVTFRAPEADFIPTLLGALYVDAITWWLEQGRPYSPGEFASRCADLASALFQKASTWE